MLIKDLSAKTGVSAKTVRYYESIGLMPPPRRGDNNYRQYSPADAERLRFIASARSLDISLSDIGEILAARDENIPPCEQVLNTLDHRLAEIERRKAARPRRTRPTASVAATRCSRTRPVSVLTSTSTAWAA